MNEYVPEVRPLPSGAPVSFRNFVDDGVLELDGRNSIGDLVGGNAVIQYGGGPFLMQGTSISKGTEIRLIGAAANTARFLAQVGLLRSELPSPNPTMNTPIHETTKTQFKGDFVGAWNGNKNK